MPGEGNTNDKRQFAKKKVDKKYLFSRLGSYLYRYKLLIVLALFLVVASNLLSLWGPSLSGKAIDAIGTEAGKVDFPTVYYYVIQMLVFYVLSCAFSYLLSLVMIRLSRQVIFKMRKDVFDRLTRLPVAFFDQYQTGDIISVISYDIDTVNATLTNDILQLITSLITVVGSLIMMLNIAPVLVLVFCVTVPLSIVFTRYFTKRVHPLFRKRSKKLGELNGFIEEMINGQKTTRAYNAEKVIIDRFDKKNKEAVDAYNTSEYYGTLIGPSVGLINNISLALVSVFGSLLYLNNTIGLGQISSFVLYSRKFSGPINETANIVGDLQSAMAAAERVFRLIDEPTETPDAEFAQVLDNVYGDVLCKNVDFGYVKEKPILKDFNLEAPSGKLIAIVGPTGAGKTTIINLLMRFYDPDAGTITVDGHEIRDVTRESLRRAYTMVLQDTWLFHGTIYENIAYGKEGVTKEEVVAAAKAARIHSFIMRLPNGYDTVLTESGLNISKGQKQLLTIARAMLLDSKMLILDKATSNVDTQTEQLIQEAMRKLMTDKTCFVIAHRLSTIRHADKILVIKDGNVVEQGNHDELLARKGFYSELYYAQFDAC